MYISVGYYTYRSSSKAGKVKEACMDILNPERQRQTPAPTPQLWALGLGSEDWDWDWRLETGDWDWDWDCWDLGLGM